MSYPVGVIIFTRFIFNELRMGLVSHIPSIMIRTITHVPDNEMRGRKMEQTQSSESLVNPLVFVCQQEKRAAGLESGRDILSQSAIVSGKKNGSSAWCVARRSRLANYIITARRALVIVSSQA